MRIVICDDQIYDIENIEKLCREYVGSKGIECEIIALNDGCLIDDYSPDILILDIEMDSEDGLSIKDRLSSKVDGPLIIFATSHQELMCEAFDRNVIGFLVKPISMEQFSKYMDMAIAYIGNNKRIVLDNEMVILSGDVLWIEACQGYSDFLMKSGYKINGGRKTMKYWESMLDDCGFIRIDDGRIVNCKYIKWIKDKELGMNLVFNSSEGRLKISRRRVASCREKFMNYCRQNGRYV